MTRTIGFLLATLTAGSVIAPAIASAHPVRPLRDTVTIESSPESISGGQTRGWSYYCPSSDPYLAEQQVTDHNSVPIWNNLSDSGVSATLNPFQTDAQAGRLTITFTNWDLFHSHNQQISYACTTQQP